MSANIILSCNDVSIGYQSKNDTNIIGSNINLSLKTGKLIALVGQNGIGKSTLLRTLAAIQKPLLGNILLNNKNINDYSNLELSQNLSLVLTEKLPPSNLTVFEIIALGRQPYTNWIGKLSDEDLLKINKAIKITNIEHLIHKKHYEISDGQLQIVLIARALAQDTPLIILDEPTTHLDLLHKATLLKLLKKLSSEANKCILFSTHDIDLAIQLADEIIVITPTKIFQNQPNNLIENNIFNDLFDNEFIKFDITNKKFVIK